MVEDFEKSDLGGPLNRYRAQEIDWQELKELDNLSIVPPSLFIGGEYDPVRRFIKIMMHTKMLVSFVKISKDVI